MHIVCGVPIWGKVGGCRHTNFLSVYPRLFLTDRNLAVSKSESGIGQ